MKEDRNYTGPRCSVCSEPATCCSRTEQGDINYCDECCGHGCDVGCFEIPEAAEARNAQGQK